MFIEPTWVRISFYEFRLERNKEHPEFGIQTVTIGNQVWMNKNLDVTTFRNGDAISEVKNALDWLNAEKYGQPAWCF